MFLMLLQYLRREGRYEDNFLHAHKQLDNINFGGHGQAYSN